MLRKIFTTLRQWRPHPILVFFFVSLAIDVLIVRLVYLALHQSQV